MTMTYDELIADRLHEGSIKHWATSDRVPSKQILFEAEQEIYKRLRVNDMLTEETGSLAIDDVSLATTGFTNTNFRTPRHFMFTGVHHQTVKLKMMEDVREAFSYQSDGTRAQGKPQIYAVVGPTLIFESAADQAYPYSFWYYAALAALSASNKTNFLTDKFPVILRQMCLSFAYDWRKDTPQQRHWLALAEKGIREANAASEEEQYFGAEISLEIGA